METKNLVLPVSIVLAAVILVAGFSLVSLQQSASLEKKQLTVELPNYLSNGNNSSAEKTVSSTFAPASDGIISFAEDSTGQKTRLISVSGSVTKTAAPEQAIILFSVETLNKDAAKSQTENAVTTNSVISALKAFGISPEDIETSSYSLREEFQWNETTRKTESTGYRTTNSIQLKVKDLSNVGGTIDAAVDAGANSVNNVSFSPTTQTEATLRAQALKEASENAKAKAESIALGLGITVGQVFSASESSNYSVPYYAKTYALDAVGAMEANSVTQISPGEIQYNATVSVQFEIQ